MKWCTIDKEYINYLKAFEPRTPHLDYGADHFKPFFAPLFTVGNCIYVTQVSSPKERHNKMKNQVGFY